MGQNLAEAPELLLLKEITSSSRKFGNDSKTSENHPPHRGHRSELRRQFWIAPPIRKQSRFGRGSSKIFVNGPSTNFWSPHRTVWKPEDPPRLSTSPVEIHDNTPVAADSAPYGSSRNQILTFHSEANISSFRAESSMNHEHFRSLNDGSKTFHAGNDVLDLSRASQVLLSYAFRLQFLFIDSLFPPGFSS